MALQGDDPKQARLLEEQCWEVDGEVWVTRIGPGGLVLTSLRRLRQRPCVVPSDGASASFWSELVPVGFFLLWQLRESRRSQGPAQGQAHHRAISLPSPCRGPHGCWASHSPGSSLSQTRVRAALPCALEVNRGWGIGLCGDPQGTWWGHSWAGAVTLLLCHTRFLSARAPFGEGGCSASAP